MNRLLYPITMSPSAPLVTVVYPEPQELSLSICSANTTERKSSIDAEKLAKQWGIGLDTATRTLKATTQLAIRQAMHLLHR